MSLGLDESKAKDVARERKVDVNYSALRAIWLALLASLVAVFVVSRLVQTEQKDDKMLFWILLAVGIGSFGASFLLKQRMLKQAIEQRKPEMVKNAYVVALALCDSIGMLGLVVHFAMGFEYYYFFFVLGGFGILMHKPQRDDLLAAVAGVGSWETRKND